MGQPQPPLPHSPLDALRRLYLLPVVVMVRNTTLITDKYFFTLAHSLPVN